MTSLSTHQSKKATAPAQFGYELGPERQIDRGATRRDALPAISLVAAQRHTLRQLGVSDDRVYLDSGMTGRNRRRPGLQEALTAVRGGDTLAVPKLDRLVRSVPDREIARARRDPA